MHKSKKTILFISHYDLKFQSSGPQVRSVNILNELKKKINVIEIHGSNLQRILRYSKIIFNSKPDLNNAYIEASSSFPGVFDLLFIIFLKIRGTNISIYIRDAYPKFRYFWLKIRLYQYFYYIGWYISIWIYKKCSNRLFFPTKSLLKLFNYEKSELLQAGLSELNNKFSSQSKNLLYIGNLNQLYGKDLLFKIIKKIRKVDKEFKLFIINNQIMNSAKYNRKGIIIINKDFKDLSDFQEKFIISFCCLNSKVEYSNFCLPIKIFDSFNWGLPIASTDCIEISQIIKKKEIGFTIDDDIEIFITTFFNIINNQDYIEKLHKNVCNFHISNNWSNRIEKILKPIK